MATGVSTYLDLVRSRTIAKNAHLPDSSVPRNQPYGKHLFLRLIIDGDVISLAKCDQKKKGRI